jgi:Thioredoxin-like domain
MSDWKLTFYVKMSRIFPRPKVLTFDHIYPPPTRTLERPPRTAVLYASLASSNFLPLHNYLFLLVNQPASPIEYVFRHIPPATRNNSDRNYLSGYGVSLDLKKMDYLALDDRHSGNHGSCRIDPCLTHWITHSLSSRIKRKKLFREQKRFSENRPDFVASQ